MSPFRSKSQARWMFSAEKRGEVKKGTAKRWAHKTKNIKSLPEKKTSRDDMIKRLKERSKEE